MKTAFVCVMLLLGVGASARQDARLPDKAPCAVCSLRGEDHGPEKVKAASVYKGQTYYFCSQGCKETFDKEPEAWLPPVLPRPAPKSVMQTLAGEEKRLADWKEKVVLVDFWATWCGPCVAAMPDLQRLHAKYADRGFAVLGVSIDEEGEKKVKPFLAKRKLTYPVLLDRSEMWKAFGVKAIPALFLVNREGQIVRQWTGKIDKKAVEQAVAKALEEPRSADR